MGFLDDIPVLKRMTDMAAAIGIAILLSVLIGLVLAFPVMWLWNFVFVPMNESLRITVFQAWAMNVLAGILFGQRSSRNSK